MQFIYHIRVVEKRVKIDKLNKDMRRPQPQPGFIDHVLVCVCFLRSNVYVCMYTQNNSKGNTQFLLYEVYAKWNLEIAWGIAQIQQQQDYQSAERA